MKSKFYNAIRFRWIRFWYNDLTRFLVIMIPSYFIILIPLLVLLGIPGELIKIILCFVYVLVFAWGIIDNDYSKLRETGLDENRRPLKK